jgi:hypothetical protein
MGGVCASSFDCGPRGLCNANNECGALLPVNSPCAAGACAAGLECNVYSNTCLPPRRNIGTGGDCVTDAECTSGRCFGSIFQGRCLAIVPLGAACSISSNRDCSRGAYCEDLTSTCKAQLGGGQPCRYGEQCIGYTCTNGLCAFPREDTCVIPH